MQLGIQYWQKIVSQLKKFATPRSRELERELTEVRRDYRELGLRASTLASEGNTARKTLESAKQQINSIHDQLTTVYQERDQLVDELQRQLESLKDDIKGVQAGYQELADGCAERDQQIKALGVKFEAPLNSLQAELGKLEARHSALGTQQAAYDRQLKTLETASEARRAREQELLTSINGLEQRAEESDRNQLRVSDQTKALAAELSDTRSEFEAVNNSSRKQLADLSLQLDDIDTERVRNRDRLQALQDSMTDAAARHSETQRYLKALQGELDGEREQNQAQLNKLEEKLTRIQIEQESLINTQSGLTDSLRKNRRWATAAMGIAFLMVVLAGVTTIRDVQRTAPEQAVVTDDTMPSSARQVVQHKEPALDEPPTPSVEAVESAAFETETVTADQIAPTAQEPQVNGAAAPIGQPPSNNTATDVSQPVSETTESAAGGSPTGAPDPAPSEAPNDSRNRHIDKSGPPHASEAKPSSKPLLTPEQAATAAQSFETKTFFEENARKEGVVSLPSGLQYRILRNGQGKSPGDRDLVILHYRGSLPDGREFGSSYADKAPAAYRVDQVIAGWREALKRMQEGARWELYIPPELAHSTGTTETPGFLPLIYQIELIAVSTATSP